MANIENVAYTNPNVFSSDEVQSSAVAVQENNLVYCIVGEGCRSEVVVNSANGNGADGWNSTYTSTTSGTDGKHFRLSKYPVISNRTILRKNGSVLKLKEETISSSPLSALYDARLDIATGKIELQGASLVDQGGSYYVPNVSNVGDGYVKSLTLLDMAAPQETWTLRCSAVRKDGYGMPMDGYSKFILSGTTSGVILDGYGSPIVWQSDNLVRNNGILSFAIDDNTKPFNVGDTFTIKVQSGVLSANDKLTAEYIAVQDINDPETFASLDDVKAKHGNVSLTNTISLAAQIAFTNAATSVMCCQAAPSMPRRQWYHVVETATGNTTPNDLKFTLPLGVMPGVNSEVKFLVVDTVTGVETQIVPNKIGFYDPTITANPDNFINTGSPYSYTVIKKTGVKKSGEDLKITPTTGPVGGTYYALVSSESTTFDLSDYVGTATLTTFGATNNINNGSFAIAGVNNGKLLITNTSSAFIAESNVTFRLLDTALADTAYVLLTKDLYLHSTQGMKLGIVDEKDADFYDAGWVSALETLEGFEVDILQPFPTQTKSAVIQNALQHCLAMSRMQNKDRILFTGAIQGLLPDNVTGVKQAAVEDVGVLEGIQGDDVSEILSGNIEDLTNYGVPDNFGFTKDCVYHYPDQIIVQVGDSRKYVDGMFIGAAHAGLRTTMVNPSMPTTNKTLVGFTIPRDRQYTPSVANKITKAGICLVEPLASGGNVVWSKTTSQSGFPEDEEMSIVLARMNLKKTIRPVMKPFIGQLDDPTNLTSATARVNSFCMSKVSSKIIDKYDNISVTTDPVEPRQMNVKYRAKPKYCINWVWVQATISNF